MKSHFRSIPTHFDEGLKPDRNGVVDRVCIQCRCKSDKRQFSSILQSRKFALPKVKPNHLKR